MIRDGRALEVSCAPRSDMLGAPVDAE